MDMTPTPANGSAPPPAVLIKDSTDRDFMADVVEASLETPVLVDFWAPWCGPCRTLTPTIEKVVNEKAGAIKLVKINIDEHPQFAGQLRVQSIPNVFAFVGGRPVDAFLGAMPESEVRKFAEKVIAAAPPAPGNEAAQLEAQVKAALDAAAAAVAQNELDDAAQIYGMILQAVPDNALALIGIAKVYLAQGETEQAQATIDSVPEEARKGDDYISVVSALKLRAEAAALSGTAALEAKIAADPDDHQSRFDLAVVLNAEGKKVEAAEALVALMRRDRNWNEDGARKKLLELFEAWGPKDPATLRGRRLLSAVLFS